MGKIFLSLVAIIAAALCYVYFKPPPPLPKMDYNKWWGPMEKKANQDTSIRPFTVNFTETMIKDLKWRLKNHQPFTPPLEGVTFEYGFNTNTLQSWVDYWAKEYPFAERQKFFNQYPHFKTNIQGLDIHFIRVTPKVPAGVEIVPMLMIHGWPGSVREFYEAIPYLTAVSKERDFALELIIPSLPGFGFSDAAVRPGLSAVEMSIVFRNLMHRLGYKKFYYQGGDMAHVIGCSMATFFPEEVLGYHSNMMFTTSPLVTAIIGLGSIIPVVVEEKYADRLYPYFSKYLPNIVLESGYFHLQASKPDTVGVGINDSPAGLAAYILEKFSTCTNMENRFLPDGGIEKYFTKEQMIDNLMLYWSTNSITSSVRVYSETFNKKTLGYWMDDIPTPVPTWAVQARHELFFTPPWLIKFKFPNLVNATMLDEGGHFLAFERPVEFSEDVLKAISGFREYHKKKSAKNEL